MEGYAGVWILQIICNLGFRVSVLLFGLGRHLRLCSTSQITHIHYFILFQHKQWPLWSTVWKVKRIHGTHYFNVVLYFKPVLVTILLPIIIGHFQLIMLLDSNPSSWRLAHQIVPFISYYQDLHFGGATMCPALEFKWWSIYLNIAGFIVFECAWSRGEHVAHIWLQRT